ncbi:MAG: HAMP domain-containing sensor histidine kinase [Mycobacterium sp.]|nr:HAMP domain-containing sensor histidine kinase [Mycobacterium sp.]
MTPAGDLSVVRRAGRIVAIQTSLALAAVLLLVGLVIATVFVRAQNNQVTAELNEVAMTADDVGDPPPGVELVLRDNDDSVATSDGGEAGVPLLSGPEGFTDLSDHDRHYRALVVDRPEGRVIALMDLAPFGASRGRLLSALALAELAGILASIGVVVLFTRRSVRPLAQALALQRRFVADASHELRAPLTVLHTRAQLLANRVSSGDLAAARKDADALVDDTRILGGIVDDLLASATMTAGTPEAARVDLEALARSVCDSMGVYAGSLGVTLGCDVSGADDIGGVDVMGSEAALRRAVTALIDNALGHEHSGGTVQLRVYRDGQQVIASVADDGEGIDPDVMPTLFNRFSHGAAHTTRAARESYGIGLALVREIVQAHGGDIRVSSIPGRGATFTMTLLAAPPRLN